MAGKGDKRRPSLVSHRTFAARWDKALGDPTTSATEILRRRYLASEDLVAEVIQQETHGGICKHLFTCGADPITCLQCADFEDEND